MARFKAKHALIVVCLLVFVSIFYRYSSWKPNRQTNRMESNNRLHKNGLKPTVEKNAPNGREALITENSEVNNSVVVFTSRAEQESSLVSLEVFQRREEVAQGQALPWCGLAAPCPVNQFPVFIYSGKNKDDYPSICIDGHFVIGKNLSKAGRGINFVVMNSTTKEILRIGRFDTYAEDSNAMEIFLEEIVMDEMVIAVTFDEASSKLSSMAKQMLYELGSSLIQNIKFRASWYFVGQKGISGFTPFEELNFASGNDWAKAVNSIICLPTKLDGSRLGVRAPAVNQPNDARRHFCEKYDGYEDFCADSEVDKAIVATPLLDEALKGSPIFKVPILVIAGLAHNSLRLCLETILKQPGVDPSYVMVTYDDNYPETADLARLFKFKSEAIGNSTADYSAQIEKSLNIIWYNYPSAELVICVEEELVLSPDFLYFMSQMLPVMLEDTTILSISAWNDNGFQSTSALLDTVYRVEGFPGLGFMMSRKTFENYLRGNFNECCELRAYEGWALADGVTSQMVVPDVSRVSRRHSDGFGLVEQQVEDLFHRERFYSTMPSASILSPESVLSRNYDNHLTTLLKNSLIWQHAKFKKCSLGELAELSFSSLDLPAQTQSTQFMDSAIAIMFVQKRSVKDHSKLNRLCACFGLYHSSHAPSRGLYRGVLRFAFKGRSVLMVGTKSPFYPILHNKLKT